MPSPHQVPQEILIRRIVDQIRRMPQISPPPWALFVKTGSHRERPPDDKDWWYTRCASILRKLYLKGPLGLSDMEREYGGRISVGYAPSHHRDASQAALRKPLQQLEAAGLVGKKVGEGRVLTGKGRSLLDKLSSEVFKELSKENPQLARYA